jgi:hypothetical protein
MKQRQSHAQPTETKQMVALTAQQCLRLSQWLQEQHHQQPWDCCSGLLLPRHYRLKQTVLCLQKDNSDVGR